MVHVDIGKKMIHFYLFGELFFAPFTATGIFYTNARSTGLDKASWCNFPFFLTDVKLDFGTQKPIPDNIKS